MIRLNAAAFYDIAQRMESARLTAVMQRDLNATDKDAPRLFLETLQDIESRCRVQGLTHTATLASHNAGRYVDRDVYPSEAEVIMSNLSVSLARELEQEYFVHISGERQRYLDSDALFGSDVKTTFPEAAMDIRDAGNCFALGLSTSAVFHLMRVAEYGLRALARKARVRIKKTPLEWAEWRVIIDAIKKKADAMALKPRGPRRESLLEFYRGSIAEFEASKMCIGIKSCIREPAMMMVRPRAS